MCIINKVVKSWLNAEISVIEHYKHNKDGFKRTSGSYMLTHMKSVIKIADTDPEMFQKLAVMKLMPIIATAMVSTLVPMVYFKMEKGEQ